MMPTLWCSSMCAPCGAVSPTIPAQLQAIQSDDCKCPLMGDPGVFRTRRAGEPEGHAEGAAEAAKGLRVPGESSINIRASVSVSKWAHSHRAEAYSLQYTNNRGADLLLPLGR